VSLTNNAGLSPCTSYDANGHCWRTVTVKIVTDTVCNTLAVSLQLGI
jgi:hypothetical protein